MNYRVSALTALCLLTLVSCVQKEPDDPSSGVKQTGRTIEVSAALTKESYSWNASGESAVLLERVKPNNSASYSYRKEYVSKETYQVDGKNCVFAFDVNEITGGSKFQYRVVSPAGALKEGSVSTTSFVVTIPAMQVSQVDAPDMNAHIVWNASPNLDAQPASVRFDSRDSKAFTACLKLSLSGTRLSPGETLRNVVVSAPEGIAIAGDAAYSYSKETFSASEGGLGAITVDVSSLDTSGDFALYAAVLPFEAESGSEITVTVNTDKGAYSKSFPFASRTEFKSGTVVEVKADMTGAQHEVPVSIVWENGNVSKLTESPDALSIYRASLESATTASSFTVSYLGVEYGFQSYSGNGCIGTVNSDAAAYPWRLTKNNPSSKPYSVNKSYGRLARISEGGSPLSINDRCRVNVTVDASSADGVLRYYLEKDSNANDVISEDFSLMCWGGEYMWQVVGTDSPAGKDPGSVDGSEAGVPGVAPNESAFSNKGFFWGEGASGGSAASETYIKSRGLEDWTLSSVGERPGCMQIGYSSAAGKAVSPRLGASVSDVMVSIALSRFGTASSGNPFNIKITGGGHFVAGNCTVTREEYTSSGTFYRAIIDKGLFDSPSTVGPVELKDSGTDIEVSACDLSTAFPHAGANADKGKPVTYLKLGVEGAGPDTRIEISGQGTTARLLLFDFAVSMNSTGEINGVRINAGNTLIGAITEETTGEPLAGIPVTDGYNYTVTDVHGVYQFKGNPGTRAVYLSIPAEYEIPLDESGQPRIWWVTDCSDGKVHRHDFTLKAREKVTDEFSIVAVTDVHFYASSFEDASCFDLFESKILPDMNSYLTSEVSAGRLKDVIMLNTGDMLSNVANMHANCKEELSKIKINGRTVPMFPTIGNHDFKNMQGTQRDCSQPYFDVYGPLDYSFNIGKAHILSLCDIQNNGYNVGGYGQMMPYIAGLSDDQWRWVQQDIATVKDKENTMLIICVHVPIFASTDPHFEDLRQLLTTFSESHIMSGHVHFNVHRQFTNSWKGKSGRLSEEHNMPPLGGNWRCGISSEGAPNSYHIFNVKGASISNHFLKAVGYDDDFQFRIYNGSDTYAPPVMSNFPETEFDVDGYYHFDWKTTWDLSGEGVNPQGKMIVKVFDGGTRGLGYRVYLNHEGKRTEMTRVSKAQRDQAAFAFYVNVVFSFNPNKSFNGIGTKYQNFWYTDIPGGDISALKDWKVELEVDNNDGSVSRYESNHVHSGYEGFYL